MIDKYVFGTATKLSFEAPIPTVDVQETEFKIGGAGTVSENTLLLGARTFLIGVAGCDEEGHWLNNRIKKIGINSGLIIGRKPVKTLLRTRLIVNNHQIARFDEPYIKSSHSFENDIVKKTKLIVPKVDCVVVCDYGKGTINKKMIQVITEFALKHKKKIIVSPTENHLDYANPSFIYRVKIDDAKKLLGITTGNISDQELCNNLESLLKCKKIILTKGDMGVTAYEDGVATQISPTHNLARDITSVGEVLVAAFAVSYSSGMSFEESCKIGNIAAGSVVEKIGAKQLTKKELENALMEYNEWGLQK